MSRQLALILIALLLGYGLWSSPDFKEVVAGVAIFLFGMMALEDGFKAFTGGTLERILRRANDRNWKSMLFGAVSTTVMQSSSLVSLISISFLSAGLLGLAQGIGIMYGANLGAISGAWLVAGFGLQVDIATYAMPMLAFGVLMVFSRQPALKGLGYVLAGLGFLLLGIHYMKDGFDALGQTLDLSTYSVPGVTGLLLFAAIGMIATVIMQSSHATLVVILTALAAGQITYENALAIAIGSNIGTTITTLLGAVGANLDGRRLAGAHVIFNTVTALVAIIFFLPLIALVDVGSALLGIADDDTPLKLAVFYSAFKIVGWLIMLPLTRPMIGWLERTLKPQPSSAIRPKFINESMTEMPAAGLEATQKELQHLFEHVFEVMARGLGADPQQLQSGMPGDLHDSSANRITMVDVDALYQQRIKPLYGEILDFLARLKTTETHSSRAFVLRNAGQRLIEALKDLKHMQKNMQRFISADSAHPREEYREIRRNLLVLLRALHTLLQDEADKPRQTVLETLARRVESWDRMANDQLDRLIRERRMSTEAASSFMNDSAYAYEIALNLLGTAGVVFVPERERPQDEDEAPSRLGDDNGATPSAVSAEISGRS